MDKQTKKKLKKGFKQLRTVFKILFLVVILAWLLFMLKDFMDSHAFLIEKVTQQTHTIDTLQHQVNEATELTTQLQAQVSLQELRIDELVNDKLTYKAPLVSLNSEPLVAPEVEPEFQIEPHSGKTALTVVTVLQILKALVFRVPAF